jgi:hypothetical protein
LLEQQRGRDVCILRRRYSARIIATMTSCVSCLWRARKWVLKIEKRSDHDQTLMTTHCRSYTSLCTGIVEPTLSLLYEMFEYATSPVVPLYSIFIPLFDFFSFHVWNIAALPCYTPFPPYSVSTSPCDRGWSPFVNDEAMVESCSTIVYTYRSSVPCKMGLAPFHYIIG